MKRTARFIFAILILALLASFTNIVTYEAKKSTADVEQFQGLYVFTNSKPVMEYDYLGTVKSTGMFQDANYVSVRDRLVKRAKKDFPTADGIILDLKRNAADQASVIKFK